MKRHNFFLTESDVARLKALAEARGVSMADLIRQAIALFLACNTAE